MSTGVVAALRDPDHRHVSWLLIAAVVLVAVLVGARQVEEGFDAASDISLVALDLAVGFIVGWIFWYLTVWRPRTADRWIAVTAAVRDAVPLAGCAGGFLGNVREARGEEFLLGPQPAETLLAFVSGLSPQDPSNYFDPHTGERETVAAALDEAWERQAWFGAKVERWTPLLDAELLQRMYALQNVPIGWDHVRRGLHGTNSLDGMSEWFLDWFRASDALILYLFERHRPALVATGWAADALVANRIVAPADDA